VSVEKPFFSPQNTTFPSVIFSLPMPFLLSNPLTGTLRLRLSMGNEGEVFRGVQGSGMKQGKWITSRKSSHKFNMLSAISSCTYKSLPRANLRG
jgi:hypothetical protein